MSQRAGQADPVSWGRRGLPGAVPTRTSPPPGGAGQRPPDGAEKVPLSGIRGISGGATEGYTGVCLEGGGQSPTCSLSAPAGLSPHLSIYCASGPSAWAWFCTPHRSRFPRCLLLFVSVNFTNTWVCKNIHLFQLLGR